MKKSHLLLIGFSCAGKTSLGKKVFGENVILDSDDEALEWIGHRTGRRFRHIYEIYMLLGRDRALALIEEAENALIDRWVGDPVSHVISLGPGFPLRRKWFRLRAMAYVVYLKRSPEGIYGGMTNRRRQIFCSCPEARRHDNWDIGVIVDESQQEIPRETAIENIRKIINERGRYYNLNDEEIINNDRDSALQKLRRLKIATSLRRRRPWTASPLRVATFATRKRRQLRRRNRHGMAR